MFQLCFFGCLQYNYSKGDYMKQSGIKDLEAYLNAVERNKQIIEWIKERGFSSISETWNAMEEEKPEWYEVALIQKGAHKIIRHFFEGKNHSK